MKTPEQTHILLISNDEITRQSITTLLQNNHYQIHAIEKDQPILEQFIQQLPDLVLLDILPSKENDITICNHIKSTQKTAHIPIILLMTDDENSAFIQTEINLNADDFVVKPIKSWELLARLQKQLASTMPYRLLQQINHDRKALLHLLCHDLSTPLSAIVSLLSVNLSYDMFMRMQHVLFTAAQNGLQLIDNVREIRELQEREVHLSAVSVKEAIKTAMFLQQANLNQKKITLDLQVDEHLYVMVENFSFTKQVINYILNNAIKFSYPNTQIVIQAYSLNDYIVALNIHDYGMGMSEKLCQHLFDLSKTTTRAGTAGEVGAGCALPLVARLINAYGGTVHIQSQVNTQQDKNGGTTVSLQLIKAV